MAFQQGLSGLASASTALDVISNNVANASNAGFKSGGTQFADVYAASLNGISGGTQVGIGTSVGRVAQLFSQGNITATANPLDLAINGQGFFTLQSADGKQVAYSRNGQYQLDKEGYIVNASGFKLMGYTTASPSIAVPITTDVASALMGAPKATDTVGLAVNMNSKATRPSPLSTPPTVAQLTNDNVFATATTIYDSKGGSHVVTTYFVPGATPTLAGASSAWDVYYSLDGTAPAATGATLQYDTTGKLVGTSAVGTNYFDIALTPPAGATYTFGPATSVTGAPAAGSIRLDMAGSTEYGSKFNVAAQSQNGYTEGQMSGISISADGVIDANYSNGQKTSIGTIALTIFKNPNGLLSEGSNMWQASYASGDPVTDKPGIGLRGAIKSSSVEDSNVDLTSQLVDMITAQRNYQANAQSIKTQDSVMQTLVNLR